MTASDPPNRWNRKDRAPRFLYVHAAEFDPTVIDSQVGDSIVAVAAHGIHFEMAVLMHGNSFLRRWRFNDQRRREMASRIGGRVSLYLAPQKTRPLGDAIGVAELWWEVVRSGRRRTVIHARGDTAAFFSSRLRERDMNVRYIYDARSDVEAEFLYASKRDGLDPKQHQLLLAGIERHRRAAVESASHIWCVSSVLRDRLHERYGCGLDRMSVIPCVADEGKFHLDEPERRATRRELGVENGFLIVYPGRLGLWHYTRETLEVVGGILRGFDDAFFLMLTPDVEVGRRMAAEALPQGRYEIRHVPHADVPRYLRAGDLGVLLRERHPLNEVACPTKFGEYILSGLPVLISAGIGDCSLFAARNHAGVILERPDSEEAVKAVAGLRSEPGAARRARLAALSAPFSRTRAAAQMAEVYLRLAAE